MHIAKKVHEAAGFLLKLGARPPERAILLEARMCGFSNELSHGHAVPFRKIPNYPEIHRQGWNGSLILGELGGAPTVVHEGRLHLFEGFLPGETAFPVRVLAAIGVRRLMLVAEGLALRDDLARGEMLFLTDHLDLTGAHAIKGVRETGAELFAKAPRPAPDAGAKARTAASAAGLPCHDGVVALIHGPMRPTPAEERMLRGFGADAVSMALATELAMATHLDLETAAFLHLGPAPWEKRNLDFCRTFLESF